MAMRKVIALLAAVMLFVGSCEAVSVTSPFGWRVHPVTGQYRFHTGVDLGYPYGDEVRAMLPGKVVYCYWWGGYGNCVILAHANGDHTLYGHMSRIDVGYGQDVVRGQSLGRVGSTGMSTGPHLHLEWWHNGAYTDPMAFFYGNVIQETEFLKGQGDAVSAVANPVPGSFSLPPVMDGMEIPESQKEAVMKQFREPFGRKEKEQADSLFFE